MTIHSFWHAARRAAALLVAAILLVAGVSAQPAGSGPLNITGVLPAPGRPIPDSLVVIFDAPIAEPRLEDGRTTAPLSFEPPVAGAFEYGPNYFSFHPSALPSNQLVRATFSPYFKGADGRGLNPAKRVLPLATAPFAPENPWTIAASSATLTLGLKFNYPARLETIRAFLAAADVKGAAAALDVTSGTGAGVWRVHFAQLAGVAWPLKLTIRRGMPEAQGLLQLEQDYTYEYGAHPEPELAVVSSSYNVQNEQTQTFTLGFNFEVDTARLAGMLRIADISTTASKTIPVTDVRDTGGGDNIHYYTISFTAPDPYDIKARLELAAGLPSLVSHVVALKAPFSKDFAVRTELLFDRANIVMQGAEPPYLNVRLNHQVEPAEFEKSLAIFPAVRDMKITHLGPDSYGIYGVWPEGTQYTLQLRPGIHFNGWATHRKTVEYAVATPDAYPPYLTIAYPGKYYFPRTPEPMLPVETRNVKKLALKLYRMFPSNIALAPDDVNGGTGDSQFRDRWSELVAQKTVDVASTSGMLARTPLALKEIMPKGLRGVFLLDVVNADKPGVPSPRTVMRAGRAGGVYGYGYEYDGSSRTRVSRIILMTNMGILAHWTNGELSLFAHDLYSLAPLEGARVRVYTNKNQLIGEGETDEGGILELKDFKTALGEPHVVFVERAGDATFLELTPRRDPEDRANVGLPPYDRQRYDGYIYGDRALYRPGEPVHLRWIGRKNYGDALAGVPLMLRILKPNGKSLLEKLVTLSAWGTGALDVETQKTYPTGNYTVQLLVPGETEALADTSFQLEEFVPNRMKAAIEIPEQPWIGAGTPHVVNVVGRHLFGGVAADRKTAARLTFQRGWSPARWRNYHFNNDAECDLGPIALGEQTTGADGKASFQFTWRMPQAVTFPVGVSAAADLFEMGGRKVSARGGVMFFPSDVCLGITGAPGKRAGGLTVQVAAVKPDESPAALDQVEVTLEKQVWNYSVRDYSTYQEPHWTGQYEKVQTRQAALKDGVGQIDFAAPDFGYYRVRVASPQTRQYSTLLFCSYGGLCRVVERIEPGLVQLKLAKPSYRIGETAELRVEAPFDGTAVIVIQGEKLRRMLTVAVVKNVGVARFRVTAEDYPNAWVEATVIHAVDRQRIQMYPFASFQMIPLRVEDPERMIQVQLPDLPKEVRPSRPLTLEVRTLTGGGAPVDAEVTLAAVDEGIHSIRGYENPDPYGWFSRSRRPDTRRAFYYDKVAYDFDRPNPGGDEGGAEMETASLGRPAANWIRTVALWSGVVRTGADGRGRITLTVPEFNGELRVVAVAVNARGVGATAASMLVRRPWILQTSMPRFLLPGDTAQCRATLYNTTDKPCRASISWAHGGTLKGGAGQREVEIAAHGEANMTADFLAGNSIGQGSILWRAVVVDPSTSQTLERLAEDDPIPVAEPAAYQRREDLIVLAPNQTTSVTNTFFLDDDLARIDLTVGAQPQLRLQKALSHVLEYPYGCVEQTTSKLFPLYLLRKNQALVQTTLKDAQSADVYIKTGIDRLFSMQTASGGLAFWPGQGNPYPYGSIYALHALTMIRNGREYEVPEANFVSLQNYVRQIAEPGGDNGLSDCYQRAYAIYTLALGGDKRALDSIERFDALTLPRPARYLLAAALAKGTRDTDRVKMYLASTPSVPWAVREFDGTLASDARNKAVELMSLAQMGAGRAQMEPLAGSLSRFIGQSRYGTTQEYAFVTAALCDYMDAVTTDILHAGAVIVKDGKENRITGREFYAGRHAGPGGRFEIRNTGRTDLYVSVATRGVPAQAQSAEVREGMAARRRFYTRAGQPLPNNTSFRQGESYIVELELFTEREARNVVVADLLPAGLEVENPRLSPEDLQAMPLAVPFGSEAPAHLEIRDERVVLVYNQLSPAPVDRPENDHHFYYVVSAVSPGAFTYPAVTAECMYDPAVRAASVAVPITVTAKGN